MTSERWLKSLALASVLLFAGLMNSGQACVAQTRILAPRSRYDEIVEKIGNAVAANIPRITITTISSISVKPFCNVFINISLF